MRVHVTYWLQDDCILSPFYSIKGQFSKSTVHSTEKIAKGVTKSNEIPLSLLEPTPDSV